MHRAKIYSKKEKKKDHGAKLKPWKKRNKVNI